VSDPFATVTIAPAIAVPTGATLKFRAHGRGSQIYTCTAVFTPAQGTDGGSDAGTTTYAWTLKAPDAKLYDQNGAMIGTHFAGPTWMSAVDESDAVGSQIAEVDAPVSDAIPWLLLEVVSHMGTGVFTDVTYVQRVNTTKGTAPITGCDAGAAGTDIAVAYTADYYFYVGAAMDGTSPQWPFAEPMFPEGLGAAGDTRYKFELHGWGDQIYTCTASGSGDAGATTYAWVFKAPSAPLYDDNDVQQGTYGAGPTWTSDDGSSIVAAHVIESAMPSPTSIPWLLLQVTSHPGPPGIFSDVTIVQQANPSGGVAPNVGCDAAHVDTDVSVHFTADYYFNTGGSSADGGAD
jgi:Protein of unknown function (DUF3455)